MKKLIIASLMLFIAAVGFSQNTTGSNASSTSKTSDQAGTVTTPVTGSTLSAELSPSTFINSKSPKEKERQSKRMKRNGVVLKTSNHPGTNPMQVTSDTLGEDENFASQMYNNGTPNTTLDNRSIEISGSGLTSQLTMNNFGFSKDGSAVADPIISGQDGRISDSNTNTIKEVEPPISTKTADPIAQQNPKGISSKTKKGTLNVSDQGGDNSTPVNGDALSPDGNSTSTPPKNEEKKQRTNPTSAGDDKSKPKQVGQPFIQEHTTEDFQLLQNYPNPAIGSTTIQYRLPDSALSATIEIFDMNGQQVQTLHVHTSGSLTVKTNDMKQGIYLYMLMVNGKRMGMERMIVEK